MFLLGEPFQSLGIGNGFLSTTAALRPFKEVVLVPYGFSFKLSFARGRSTHIEPRIN